MKTITVWQPLAGTLATGIKEEVLLLRHKGRDIWDRPVYEDKTGKLWKDVEPMPDIQPNLYTALGNDFDGEPNLPMSCMKKYNGVMVVFEPERDTW